MLAICLSDYPTGVPFTCCFNDFELILFEEGDERGGEWEGKHLDLRLIANLLDWRIGLKGKSIAQVSIAY